MKFRVMIDCRISAKKDFTYSSSERLDLPVFDIDELETLKSVRINCATSDLFALKSDVKYRAPSFGDTKLLTITNI